MRRKVSRAHGRGLWTHGRGIWPWLALLCLLHTHTHAPSEESCLDNSASLEPAPPVAGVAETAAIELHKTAVGSETDVVSGMLLFAGAAFHRAPWGGVRGRISRESQSKGVQNGK